MGKLDDTKRENLRQFARSKEEEAGTAIAATEQLVKRDDLTGAELTQALNANSGAASKAQGIAQRVRRFVGGQNK